MIAVTRLAELDLTSSSARTRFAFAVDLARYERRGPAPP